MRTWEHFGKTIGTLCVFLFLSSEIATVLVFEFANNWKEYVIYPLFISLAILAVAVPIFGVILIFNNRKNIQQTVDEPDNKSIIKDLGKEMSFGVFRWVKNYFIKASIISAIAVIPFFFLVNSWDDKINDFYEKNYMLFFLFSAPLVYLPFSVLFLSKSKNAEQHFDILLIVVYSIFIAFNTYEIMCMAFNHHDILGFVIIATLFALGTIILVSNEFKKLLKKKKT